MAILNVSLSTQVTLFPASARHAQVTKPTYPVPTIVIFICPSTRVSCSSPAARHTLPGLAVKTSLARTCVPTTSCGLGAVRVSSVASMVPRLRISPPRLRISPPRLLISAAAPPSPAARRRRTGRRSPRCAPPGSRPSSRRCWRRRWPASGAAAARPEAAPAVADTGEEERRPDSMVSTDHLSDVIDVAPDTLTQIRHNSLA